MDDVTKPLTLHQIIWELERIDRESGARIIQPETAAQQAEQCGELLFRWAGRVRHGRNL